MSGLNGPAFEQQGTEEQCRAVVIVSRWPTGFECPVCGGLQQHSLVTTRHLYQCKVPAADRLVSKSAAPIRAQRHAPGSAPWSNRTGTFLASLQLEDLVLPLSPDKARHIDGSVVRPLEPKDPRCSLPDVEPIGQ